MRELLNSGEQTIVSWRRWLALLLLAAAPAAGEAALLRAVGFGSALSLAPQITSISPYGSFHDLRWILVYHSSWPVLVVELLAAVVIRTGWAIAMSLAAAPYAAGPGAAGSPSAPGGGVRVLAVRVLAFHAFAVVVLAPWATMAVAAAQTSLSWFLPGEVLPLLLLGLVLQRGGTGQSWWRGAPSRRLLGLGLVAFATVPAASLVVASTPKWWVVPVAGAAGATNGWLWRQVVCSPALPADRRIGRAPVPIIVAGALLLSLASAGPLAGLGRLNTQEPLPAVTGPLVTTVRRPVIFVGGYDTDWDGSPTRVGLPLETFSYRGLNPAGRPLPYRTTDTHTSLAHTAALLRSQVSAASRQAGRPVSLIAMSEGTLVVRRYLADTPDPSVNAVVLISPLIQASRVYLPPKSTSGWGIGTGWLMRGMLAAAGFTGGPPISPDEPFARSLLDDAVLYRNQMLCPVRGVRMMAFVPLADATVVPPDGYAHIPLVGLLDLHGGMLPRADVQRELLAFLAGGPARGHSGPAFPIVQKAASGWQAPALALRLNPAWHAAGQPDASFDQDGCAVHPRQPG